MKPTSGLESIPGIGKSLAEDLRSLGILDIKDLSGKQAEALYKRLEKLTHSHQDRCVLYTFRCAIYYAEGGRNPDKLKWWNWKE